MAASAALLTASSTAHAAWLAPHDVPVGVNSQSGGAAIAPDGTVTTTVLSGSGSQRTLSVAIKPPGEPFRPAVTLSKPGGDAAFAFTRSDRAGNVVVAWEEQINGVSVVRAATKAANGELTPAQSVSDTGMSARWPRVVIAGGKAVVAWAQGGRVRAASATAGSAFSVHDPLTAPVGFDDPPAVAVAPDGAAVVAWQEGSTVRAAARAAGGEFAPLPVVASTPVPHVREVHAAMSVNGRATLAWAYAGVLQTASRGKTGSFGGVETVPGAAGASPGLAMSDDDTALLAWMDTGGPRYATRPLGGGFGPVRTIPGATFGSASVPRVAFGADGSARVLWVGSHGPRSAVDTARIAPDGTSEPAQTVSPPSEAPAGQNDSIGVFIGLGVNDHGDAVAAWLHSYDAAPGPAFDTRVRVRTAILDATPPAVTGVRILGSAVQGRPVTMQITATDPLSGATASWSFGDGTTAQGASQTKTYNAAGVFTVRVTVTDGAGNARTIQQPVDVLARKL